MKLCWFS